MQIVSGFQTASLGPLLMALIAAAGLWYWLVPRSLRGLQVAFERAKDDYEVHVVTRTIDDARELLSQRGMWFGVANYISALTGILLFLFEWLFAKNGLTNGYSQINLGLGLFLISVPAVVSIVVSLNAQVIPNRRDRRATMQETTISGILLMCVVGGAWFLLVMIVHTILGDLGLERTTLRALTLFIAFLPAVIAYGRVMGSSWLPLIRSNKKVSRGQSSDLYPRQPSTKRQFASMIVYITAFAMPFTAINALISVGMISFSPEVFTHSPQVLALPEYTQQTSVMEEGGALGFFAIEWFSGIEDAGIRVPLVTVVLLFLLLNVAVVGAAFVYEVARILFLGLGRFAGRGGLVLAESRLLRADQQKQAKVLNFCFSGFAGQSMLLLGLAMFTFWDSAALPQGSECGSWESNVCAYLEKDMLENLTWMLAAGGQIAFLMVWTSSWLDREQLDRIKLTGGLGEHRVKMRAMESTMFLKQSPITDLIANGDWSKALSRWTKMEDSPDGLEFVRRQQAGMVLHAGQGSWDEAEEAALSILALRGGEAPVDASLVLVAASLAQRDFPEASPRLERLPQNNQEAVSLRWISSVLATGNIKLDSTLRPTAALSASVRVNKDLIQRWGESNPWSKKDHRNDPLGRKLLLGDVARMRLAGRSAEALDQLEFWLKKNDEQGWVMGDVARALLYLDRNMKLTATRIQSELVSRDPDHPSVRDLHRTFNQLGLEEMLPDRFSSTEFDWISVGERGGSLRWMNRYTVQPLASDGKDQLKDLTIWDGNGWALLGNISDKHPSGLSLKQWRRKNKLPSRLPLANHLLLSGLLATIGGMPVDLGFPADIDPSDPRIQDLLHL